MAIIYEVASYSYLRGDILMVKQYEKENPDSEVYSLPGGLVNDNEKGIDLEGRVKAVARETRLKTGLQILNPTLRAVIFFDNSQRKPKAPDRWVHIFHASEHIGKLSDRKNGNEIPVLVKDYGLPNVPKKNRGDKLMYEWLRLHNNKFFSGVIKHVGTEVDLEKSFPDFFPTPIEITPKKPSLIRNVYDFMMESYKARSSEGNLEKIKRKSRSNEYV